MEFGALYWHLGPFGRQDVHLHSRIDREAPSQVLVGYGRTCKASEPHVRKPLLVASKWSRRDQEGTSL